MKKRFALFLCSLPTLAVFSPAAADGKGRTLSCNTEALTADRPEGAVFTVEYTGKNRDKNVKVTSSGEGFEYFLKEREGRERARMTLRTPRGNVIIPVCRIPLFL